MTRIIVHLVNTGYLNGKIYNDAVYKLTYYNYDLKNNQRWDADIIDSSRKMMKDNRSKTNQIRLRVKTT